MFKVSRNGRDLVVISKKYVDELRNLPEEKLSSIQALIAVRDSPDLRNTLTYYFEHHMLPCLRKHKHNKSQRYIVTKHISILISYSHGKF